MDNLRKSFLVKGNSIVGALGDKYFSNAPIGVIQAFSGNTIPNGYLLCNGTSYKVADYPDLYAVIGNTYGGDTENFNVPNLVDKFIQGSTTSGEEKEAGLPNITGTFYHDTNATSSLSGAFFSYTRGSSQNLKNDDTVKGSGYISFDASKSNSIYGKSTTVQPPALTMVYIIKAFHTNEGVDSGVSDDVINYVNATKELLKYKDISSTCVFKTDAMGSNGKLPKVYKNYNSIVIQWDNVVIDEVSRSASYGHIKIPKNSNYDYIIQEGSISVVNAGTPKGIARFFASSTIDDDYLYVSITGDMYAGKLATGVDTVRGITTFYFIEK